MRLVRDEIVDTQNVLRSTIYGNMESDTVVLVDGMIDIVTEISNLKLQSTINTLHVDELVVVDNVNRVRVDTLELSQSNSEEAYQGIQNTISTITSSFTVHTTQLQNLTSSTTAMNGLISNTTTDVLNLTNSTSTSIGSLNSLIVVNRDTIATVDTRLEGLIEETFILSNTLTDTVAHVNAHDQNLQDLTFMTTTMSNSITYHTSELASHEAKISSIDADAARMISEIAFNTDKINTNTSAITSYVDQLSNIDPYLGDRVAVVESKLLQKASFLNYNETPVVGDIKYGKFTSMNRIPNNFLIIYFGETLSVLIRDEYVVAPRFRMSVEGIINTAAFNLLYTPTKTYSTGKDCCISIVHTPGRIAFFIENEIIAQTFYTTELDDKNVTKILNGFGIDPNLCYTVVESYTL